MSPKGRSRTTTVRYFSGSEKAAQRSELLGVLGGIASGAATMKPYMSCEFHDSAALSSLEETVSQAGQQGAVVHGQLRRSITSCMGYELRERWKC